MRWAGISIRTCRATGCPTSRARRRFGAFFEDMLLDDADYA
jgi:hypothetical protein